MTAGDPTFRRLLDWVEGRLTRRDAAVVGSAVGSGRPEVQATVAWIRGFVRFGRANPLPRPPAIVRQRLEQSFVRHHGRAAPIRRETAELMFDSRDDAVVVGVRGGPSLDDGYRLAFASPSVGVLLDVLPDGDDPEGETVRLEGQVLDADPTAPVWAVTVHHRGGERTDIGGDVNGSFAIDRVPHHTSRLVLSNGLIEVQILGPLDEYPHR